MPVRGPEVTEAFSSFEAAEHPVCEAYDWDAWPLIRCMLGVSHVLKSLDLSSGRSRTRPVAPWGARSLARAPGWFLQTRGSGFRGVPSEQVAIITASDRGQSIGGKYYRYMADPAARMLTESGVTSAVWEFGRPAWPSWHEAFFCEAPLYARAALLQLFGRVTRINKKPGWFDDISDWHSEVFGYSLSWETLGWILRSAEAMRRVYEGWFRKAGTRLVLTDIWYALSGLTAILAARDLDIPAIDLQHGVQSVGHFAYSGWRRDDYGKRRCAFPSGFWVWGPRDARGLEDNNPGVVGHDKIFAVGYPWLNEWMDPSDEPLREADATASRLAEGWQKVVLVTPHIREHVAEALDLANRGPSDWLWLIRMHRAWRGSSTAVEDEARSMGLGRVVSSVQATELPLYALMRHCDAHATWFSTCALEATAFGVPTVLLDRVGETYYPEYVRAGLMRLALDKDDAVKEIAGVPWGAPVDQGDLPAAFSTPAEAQAEMKRMLSTYQV